MCPDGYFRPPPSITNVWMMPLLFGDFAYSINKGLRRLEILKLILLTQVVLRDHFPTGRVA